MEMNFYKLSVGWGTQFYIASFELPDEEEDGMRGFTGVIEAEIKQGGRAGDLMRTYSTTYFCSQRFVDVLQENNFTGYSTYDVRLTGGRGEELPRYYGIVATTVGGKFLPEEAGLTYFEGSEVGMQRMAIDTTGYPSLDFFYVPPYLGAILITEDVRKALKRAKLTNLVIRHLDEVSY